jgi:uncharacterized membrane protein YtjA (UPF0391 family)
MLLGTAGRLPPLSLRCTIPRILAPQESWRALTGRGGSMFRWAVIFLVVTFVAGIFAFAGLVLAAAALAKLIFYLFLVLFLLALIAGLLRKSRSNIGD